MPPVPKVTHRLPKKQHKLRQYRLRPPAEVTPGLFPKPREYDRKEDFQNQKLARERDSHLCQWHLKVLGQQRRTNEVHHIYGRRRNWQLDAMILLCRECHDCFHRAIEDNAGNRITQDKLIDLVKNL